MDRDPYFLKRNYLPDTELKARTSSMTCINQVFNHILQDNPIGATPLAQSTPASVYFGSSVQTPGESFYLPSEPSLDVTPDSRSTWRDDSTPLTKLNEFFESRDVSPVSHTVTVSWSERNNASSPSSQGTTGSRCCLGGSCAQAIREVVACSCSIFESTIPHWLWKRG